VAAVVRLLKAAQRPLIIVGKGAAYSGAEKEVQQLANRWVCAFVRVCVSVCICGVCVAFADVHLCLWMVGVVRLTAFMIYDGC
jgi:thiamine pyrophosphate-dependent acetolactate synthase large subunit-like protein